MAAIGTKVDIGFDSVSTHAEEAKNPRRDVPIGIISSLIICTVLYIAVSAILTGMVPYNEIDINAPVSNAFARVGLPWAQFLISLGALAGITSVLLVMMLSQPRVLLAMARDGLVPPSFFGAVHEKFRTPWKSTMLTGLFVATMAALLPLRVLAELVNIGTLLAFVMVCGAILIMRYTDPDAERPFRAPALRVIIPPLARQYLNLTKNSSLAILIGYYDLVNVGQPIFNQTGRAVEMILMIMATYLVLSLLTSALMNYYNRRIRLVER